MKNFEELEALMHKKKWLDTLKPYMKQINKVPYNNHWLILMYNLFDMPGMHSDLFKAVCQCRGTVVDTYTKKVVCGPFVKFFNYGEGPADAVDFANAWYTHKRDGWLFKVLKLKGKYYPFSNGTAVVRDSGAPVTAMEINGLKFKTVTDVFMYAIGATWDDNGYTIHFEDDTTSLAWDYVGDGDTVMFELESPWNKVYTDLVRVPKAWLIGYRKANGDEVNVFQYPEDTLPLNRVYDHPEVYHFKSIEECLAALKSWRADKNGEGIVAMSIDKNGKFLRVKLKADDYLKIKYETDCLNIADNRLMRLILNNEVDDILAAQPTLQPRVDAMKALYAEIWPMARHVCQRKDEILSECEDRRAGYNKVKEAYGDFTDTIMKWHSADWVEKLKAKLAKSALAYDKVKSLHDQLDKATKI